MNTALAEGTVAASSAPAQRSLRIAFVTETYPPEINGVAMSTARIVEGLRRRQHELQLIRPRQHDDDTARRSTRFHELLTGALPIPRYPDLRMGVPSKRALVRLLAVVSRGVDRLQFSPAKRSDALRALWGAGPGDPVVICVGRLAHDKNLGVLIEAFDAIACMSPGARLVFVGDGPIRAELQARCPGAVFAGQRSGDDLAAHYASADLFLFSSQSETFGNVTVEALASGLPTVAFDYAAAAQLIRHGDNGLLVPLGDSAGFVRCAVELAVDSALCQAMRHRARAPTDQLGWDGIVMRFEAVLRASIAQASLTSISFEGILN